MLVETIQPKLTPEQERDIIHRMNWLVREKRTPWLLATIAKLEQLYIEHTAISGRDDTDKFMHSGLDDLLGLVLLAMPPAEA